MPIFFDTAIGAPAGYAGAGLVGSMINPLTPLDPQWLDNDNRGSRRASNGTSGTKLPREDEWKPEGPLKQTQQYLDFYSSLDNARQMLDYKTTNALNEAYDRGDMDAVRRIEGEYQQGISQISSMKNQRQITEHSLKVEAGNRQQAYTDLKPVMDNPALLQDASSLLDNPERFIENLVSIDNSNVRYNPKDNELYRADSDSKDIIIDDGLLMLKPGAKNKLTGRNYFDFSTNYEALGYFDRNQEAPLLPDGTINPVAAQFKTPHKSVISGKEHFENVRGALKDAGNLSMESNPLIVNIASGSNLDMGALQETINNTRTYYAANSNTATFKTDIPNINAVIAGTWGILSPEAKNYVFTQYAKENRENIVGATDAALNAEIAETKYSKALEMKTNGDTTITDKKLQELKTDAEAKKAESVKIGKLITDDVKHFAFLQTLGISQGMESLKYMMNSTKGSGEEGGANGKATPLSASTVPGAKLVPQSFGYKEPAGNYSRKVVDTFSFDMSETAKNNYFGEEGVKKMEQRKDSQGNPIISNYKLEDKVLPYVIFGGMAVRPDMLVKDSEGNSATGSNKANIYITKVAPKGMHGLRYDTEDRGDGGDGDGIYGNLMWFAGDDTALEIAGGDGKTKRTWKTAKGQQSIVPMTMPYMGLEIVVELSDNISPSKATIPVPKANGGYEWMNIRDVMDNKDAYPSLDIQQIEDKDAYKFTVYAPINDINMQRTYDNKLIYGAKADGDKEMLINEYAERGRAAVRDIEDKHYEELRGKTPNGVVARMSGVSMSFDKKTPVNTLYKMLVDKNLVKDIAVQAGIFGISDEEKNIVEGKSKENIKAINNIPDELIKNKLLVYELWKKETKLHNMGQLIGEKKIMYFIEGSSLDELKQAINYNTKFKVLPYQLILQKNKAAGGTGKEF